MNLEDGAHTEKNFFFPPCAVGIVHTYIIHSRRMTRCKVHQSAIHFIIQNIIIRKEITSNYSVDGAHHDFNPPIHA